MCDQQQTVLRSLEWENHIVKNSICREVVAREMIMEDTHVVSKKRVSTRHLAIEGQRCIDLHALKSPKTTRNNKVSGGLVWCPSYLCANDTHHWII